MLNLNTGSFRLDGKNALVTGGGKGIGFAIAQNLIGAGANVMITGRTEETLVNACRLLGENAAYLVHDLTDYNSIGNLIQNIEKKFNTIDILINNAGIHLKKWDVETSVTEIEKVIQTNLVAVHLLTTEVLKKWMIPQESGSVIFIASMASFYGIPQVVAYSSAKSGLLGMTRTLAVELGQHNIRVNAIASGFIESEMSIKAMNADPDRKKKVLGRTPLGKFGKPEDVGMTAVFLASDASVYITGAVIPVDGGNSIGF